VLALVVQRLLQMLGSDVLLLEKQLAYADGHELTLVSSE
jgi:hypothetical protein